MTNPDGKPANVAALDEKTYGADARESRHEMLTRNAKGDHLGAAAALAKGAVQAMGHQLAHPIESTNGAVESLTTPSEARKQYLANEKSR